MTSDEMLAAFEIPASSRVDQRVPKKLLLENGAPTAADKRFLNEGVDAVLWLAALKPTTIGVPEYRDDVREYLEIAVLRLTLRAAARATRLVELVHRAVPYPLLLLTEQDERPGLSVAHKRWSQAEAGVTVLEGDVVAVEWDAEHDGERGPTFCDALALGKQPGTTLHTLYQGWIDTLLALQTARVTGAFAVAANSEHAAARRDALQECAKLDAEIARAARHRRQREADGAARGTEPGTQARGGGSGCSLAPTCEAQGHDAETHRQRPRRRSHPTSSPRTSPRLRALFPALVTEGPDGVAVNVDVLKQLVGDRTVTDAEEKYGLNWHGKRRARQLALTPSTGTLRPCPEDSVDWDTTQNLIIEGDNLEVLKLLQKSYAGKVKLIYIDPPYNTGKDFVYPDNFQDSIHSYLELTGQTGESGQRLSSNTEASGRFHTDWLNMMYPRLKLARSLLREDGVMFVSIADQEIHNLRSVMDEVFGLENFIATVIWHKMDSPKNSAIHFSEDHDYVLIYAKEAATWRPNGLERTEGMIARYKNPDDDPRGVWLLSDLAARNFYAQGRYKITTKSGRVISGPPAGSYWRVNREKFDELNRDNRIWWGTSGDNRPGIKRFLSDVRLGVVPQTYWPWKDVGSTRNAKQELSQIMGAEAGEDLFVTPKPTRLVQRMLQIGTETADNDIVFDFFGGSGTTGHAVLTSNSRDNGNRRYILIQVSRAHRRPQDTKYRRTHQRTSAPSREED